MSYEEMSIDAALRRIHQKELLLPAIQRDFVWAPERIYALLDSILRGYPFGTLLLWNTKERVQYREFCQNWQRDQRYTFLIKEQGRPATMVLDGQQRLQSLYLAVYGTHEQKVMYMDLLSGEDHDDISEAKYHFEFLSAAEAAQRNEQHHGSQLWVRLKDILDIPAHGHLMGRSDRYRETAGVQDDADASARLGQNLADAYFALKGSPVLNYFTIDKDYGEGGVTTRIDEVLEIFVRVNSGGQVLSRSDLMFSLMQLHWEGAADAIGDVRDELNGKGRFDFDKDFILRCALVCTGQGARYEVRKLRAPNAIAAIEEAFPGITRALVACVDFLVNTAKIHDRRILGSNNAIIPFVYFFYRQPNQELRGEENLLAVNQALYLALMTSVFTRYADSRIDQAVRDVLTPAPTGTVPLAALKKFAGEKEGRDSIDDWLLQRNIPLLMNIIEGGAQLPEGTRHYRPEYDHIFPQAGLRERGYAEELINDFANFRLISKKLNIWKTDQPPDQYFEGKDEVLRRYLMPPDLLHYEQYVEFLQERRRLIWERVCTFLAIPEPPPQPRIWWERYDPDPRIERLCGIADNCGVGEGFRHILKAAREAGLHPRPCPWSIMYAPQQDRRRCLFVVWAQEHMPVYVSTAGIAEFFGNGAGPELLRAIGDSKSRNDMTEEEVIFFAFEVVRLLGPYRDR